MTEAAPPTLAERYQTARETSNMRVTVDPCPADMIMAAAFSRDPNGERNTAGAIFTRLRGEFDQIHAEVRKEAAAPQPISRVQFASFLQAKRPHNPALLYRSDERETYLLADGRTMTQTSNANGVKTYTVEGIGAADERIAVMMRLKSLKAAKVALLAISDRRATRGRLTFAAHVMPELTWQALSAWLDPRCSHCHGVGFKGGYDGTPQTFKCIKCDAGNRRGFVGKTDAERSFVDGLIGDIESAMAAFEAGMSAARRG